MGFEKSHSSCCAAGVGDEEIVIVAAGGVAVVCIGLRGRSGARAIFPVPHRAGNGLMGSRGGAVQESCFPRATFCLARTRQAPT